jgi:hypothetical protein
MVVTAPVRRKQRVHPIFIICILMADVGASIPFTVRAGAHDTAWPILVVILDICFWVATLALVARLVNLIRPHKDAAALAFSAGAWAAFAAYAAFFLTTVDWEYRTGFGLIFLAFALLCAAAYVQEVYG